MEEVELCFEIEKYNEFKARNIDFEEFISSVIFDKGNFEEQGNFDLICSNLLAYHSENGGTPVVEDFTFENVVSKGMNGNIILSYDVSYFFGCADIDRVENHTENIKFKIDRKSHNLVLFFPKPIRRTTADEF